jgi:hypothetical protein
MVPCPAPKLRYNDREYAATGSDHADLLRGGTSVYIILVLLVMLVLPAFSVVNERYFLGSHAGLLPLVGKWFVFWAVGIRLVSAGARQTINPEYTAETILGLKTSEPWVVVRELGFANIAIGTVALGSILAHQWLTPAAVAGAVFYGLAGTYHLVRKNRNRLQSVTMLSDLFVCGILCAYCLAVVAR